MARSLMLVGTSSNVGKSVLCTAFCRIFYQDGYRVAPFKAQNMSLNSAVTPSGREIGRAQAVQAEACCILPNEHMNPVLLKPTGQMRSQVVLQGRVHGVRSAREYFGGQKTEIWEAVTESYRFLSERYDLIVLEGAGSPVEMNLKPRDIANMRAAEMADASVILVADIDRGGVFASAVGTLQLLEPHERARVKGIVVNKFRGDPSLFEEGVKMLEAYAGVPVLGVIPYLDDLGIDEEDSVALESDRYRKAKAAGLQAECALRIGIVQLPHLSNFTDFDPLFLEPDVDAFFCTKPDDVLQADAVILPGTKSTIADLLWLKQNGWIEALKSVPERGSKLFGICGGYQMLGNAILDPEQCESEIEECDGLGFFDGRTVMSAEKRTVLAKGVLLHPLAAESAAKVEIEGYEIHMGITEFASPKQPFAGILDPETGQYALEGFVSADGNIMGTYLHGILHNDSFRLLWLNALRRKKGWSERTETRRMDEIRQSAYNRLADQVRKNVKMELVYRMLGLAITNEKGDA